MARRHHVQAESLLREATAKAVASKPADQVILVGQVVSGSGEFKTAPGQGTAGAVDLSQPLGSGGLALLTLEKFGALELFKGPRTGGVGPVTDYVVTVPTSSLANLARFAKELRETSGIAEWWDLLDNYFQK